MSEAESGRMVVESYEDFLFVFVRSEDSKMVGSFLLDLTKPSWR